MSAVGAALAVLFASAGCSTKDVGKGDNAASSPSYSQQTAAGSQKSEESLSSPGASASSKSELSKENSTSAKSSQSASKSTYAYAYAGFNPAPANMNAPYTELLLNKKHILPDGYVPKLA